VSEEALLRDVIYAFQGINGALVSYDAAADAYLVAPTLGVPRATRDLVSKLTEIGWLFAKIRHYVIASRDDKSFGLVGQVGDDSHTHEHAHKDFHSPSSSPRRSARHCILN
jgi:gamma-tubulin complex component 3